MTQEFEAFAAKATSDHEIQIFYRIDGLTGKAAAEVKLGQVAGCSGTPGDQRPALKNRYAATAVWKEVASSEAGHDFHDHVRELIDGRRPNLVRRLTLGDIARQFLATASLYERDTDSGARSKKRLQLSLSEAAKRRLARYAISSGELFVQIAEVGLFVADTRHAFAVATVCLSRPDRQAISAAEILEAVILLVRFGKVRWVSESGRAAEEDKPFVLGELVQFMACGRAVGATLERVTTSTFVQFAEPLDKQVRDRFAVHLARHYTSDYEISSDITGVAFVRDFDTVRHAVALEGAATVVGPVPGLPGLPAFVSDFKTVTYRRHYVPIALLARHEHAFLVRRTSMASESAADMPESSKTIAKLARLRRDFIHFRLSYRFSELSFVSMHNKLNQAYREVLNLDRMMADLGADVAAADTLLRENYEKRKYSRFYLATASGAAALSALTGFTIVKELAGIFNPGGELRNGGFALIGALVGGSLSAFVAFLKRPADFEKGIEDDDLVEEMMHHVVIDEADKA